MTEDFLASEASRLINDRVLLRAVAEMRLEALEALVDVDASSIYEVHKLQARVFACDELLASLKRFIDAVSED
jgi:hypothetical protein